MKRDIAKSKNVTKKIIANIFRYIFLIAFSYILIYPLLYIITTTFKDSANFYDPTVEWVPKSISFENIRIALKAMNFLDSFKSSMINEMVAALIEVLSCAVAAYGLARFEFKGKKIFTGIMILTILVPSTMIIIPSYINFRYMDFAGILGFISEIVGKEIRPSIIDTPLVFWLPSILSVGLKGGLFIYIYMQFFKGLPKEFEEAAWLDGAGPWGTFLKVIVPNSGVAAVTVLLFSVVWHWNDYYLASMYLSENYPLSVNLLNITDLINGALYGEASLTALTGPIIMSACLLCVVPMIIFYLIFQRKFMVSVASSGIVG